MQQLQDFECPICLEFCREAVESECCAHAFCKECSDEFIVKKKECPYCRCPDFQTRESRILRRVISQIKVQCSNEGCGKKIATSELGKHELSCEFRKMKCKYCSKDMLLRALLEHCLEIHKDEVQTLLVRSYQAKNQSKVHSQIKDAPQVGFNPAETVRNSKGRQAGLGTTGKYYCGGELGFKCLCCDGGCGPTNGQNCISCMQLDLKVRNLGKGYLVNSIGSICKIEQNKAFCGLLLGTSLQARCNKNKLCQNCQRTTNSLPRYKALLQ